MARARHNEILPHLPPNALRRAGRVFVIANSGNTQRRRNRTAQRQTDSSPAAVSGKFNLSQPGHPPGQFAIKETGLSEKEPPTSTRSESCCITLSLPEIKNNFDVNPLFV